MTSDKDSFFSGPVESVVGGDEWVPRGIDPRIPNVARIYDYHLGGKDNYEADRAVGEAMRKAFPLAPDVAKANRQFLEEVVRYCAEQGVRQYIDIGSGLPTRRNVHEVAREYASDARVVYVDNDPIVVRHAQALLPGEKGRTAVIEADVREPEKILNHPSTVELIDFSQPVAVLMLAVLHFVPDSADPRDILARFRSAMAPGSFLALSVAGGDRLPERTNVVTDEYSRANAAMVMRTRAQIAKFFEGLEMVEPGLVPAGSWRQEVEYPRELEELLGRIGLWGLGRKP